MVHNKQGCLILSGPDKQDIRAKIVYLWLKYIWRVEMPQYTHLTLWFDNNLIEATFDEAYIICPLSEVMIEQIAKEKDLLLFFNGAAIMEGFYERLAEFENKKLTWIDFIRAALRMKNENAICTQFIAALLGVKDWRDNVLTPYQLMGVVKECLRGKLYIKENGDLSLYEVPTK